MLVARRRHADIDEIARFIAAEEVHHTRRFLKRQASQEQIVYQTEDCRVRTDGERERNHGDDGEPWRFSQRPERVFEVRDHKIRNSLGDYDGERGRLARCFWRPAKNLRAVECRSVLHAFESCRARRTTQRARRPRSPEVVAAFSFGTKGNNGINPRSSARG